MLLRFAPIRHGSASSSYRLSLRKIEFDEVRALGIEPRDARQLLLHDANLLGCRPQCLEIFDVDRAHGEELEQHEVL